MSSQMKKVQLAINTIDMVIGQLYSLKRSLKMEEGIHFRVIHSEGFSYIDMWDTNNDEPRLLVVRVDPMPFEALVQHACRALSLLTPKAKQRVIFWKTHGITWSDLPEDFQQFNTVFTIEQLKLTDEEVNELKMEQYAIHDMSKLDEVQASN